jgi:hypothetical protein
VILTGETQLSGKNNKNYILRFNSYCAVNTSSLEHMNQLVSYMGADKSLARPGRKQARATGDFEFHISYLK